MVKRLATAWWTTCLAGSHFSASPRALRERHAPECAIACSKVSVDGCKRASRAVMAGRWVSAANLGFSSV